MQLKSRRFKWTNKVINNESGPSYEMNRINKARLNVCKKGKSESSILLLLKPLMSVWLNEHYKSKLTVWTHVRILVRLYFAHVTSSSEDKR